MDHISAQLAAIERTIKFDGADALTAQGFTQVPNFILKNPKVSLGTKVTYAMLISYGWHK
jgi:hypothetical protein